MNKRIILLVALLFGLVMQFFGALGYFVLYPGTSVAYGLYVATKVLLVILPLYFLRDVGVWWKTFFSWDKSPVQHGFLWGGILGFVVWLTFFVFQTEFLLVKETIVDKVSAYRIQAFFIPFALFVSIIHSGIEEYYWRGFVFGGLKKYLSVPYAMTVSSLAFASHHFLIVNEFFSVLVSLGLTAAVMVGGLVWCYLYQRTGKLVASWLSHAIIDGVILGIVYFYFL